MTQALATVQYKPTEIGTEQLGSLLVKSGYFADTRDVAQAIVKVLAGRELGFGSIASMQGVYIVKGRVTLSANLVGAAIQRSSKYGYGVVKLTDTECVLEFYTIGGQSPRRTFESKFTIEDAKTAGLLGDTYKKFPRNMLFSRALTNGARWFCPEVFNGPIYTPDELGALVEVDGRVVDADSGEVVDSPFVPTRERDVVDETVQAALEMWAAACGEAERLGVSHKELPDNASLDQIERWTIALTDKLEAITRQAGTAA